MTLKFICSQTYIFTLSQQIKLFLALPHRQHCYQTPGFESHRHLRLGQRGVLLTPDKVNSFTWRPVQIHYYPFNGRKKMKMQVQRYRCIQTMNLLGDRQVNLTDNSYGEERYYRQQSTQLKMTILASSYAQEVCSVLSRIPYNYQDQYP